MLYPDWTARRTREVLQRYGTEKFEDHVCRDCGMRYSNGEKAHQVFSFRRLDAYESVDSW